MFSLRIHSADIPEALSTSFSTTSSSSHGLNPGSSSTGSSYNRAHPTEFGGVIHLFRQLPLESTSSTSSSTTIVDPTALVFVVAVPNYFSSDNFLLFCGSHLSHFENVLFLRNDAVEDRYSVLIRLVSQSDADDFYSACNGIRFKPSEVELCHIYFIQSVEFTDVAEIASTPPLGFTQLPTCPICLERLDREYSGIHSTICDHSFHCSCISNWTYLSCQVCRFCQQQDDDYPHCSVCGTLENLWICMICGSVGCGWNEGRHGITHWNDTQHYFSLDLETQRIWDYFGDQFAHRLNHFESDGKVTLRLINGECVSFGYEDDSELEDDSGLDGAQLDSRVEADYESLYAEAKQSKNSSVSEAVEKFVFSKTRDFECQLESVVEEMNAVAERNKELLKNQELLKQKYKEIDDRLSSSIKTNDDRILDLTEQIRDVKMYVEAQKKIANMKDSDKEDIKGVGLLEQL